PPPVTRLPRRRVAGVTARSQRRQHVAKTVRRFPTVSASKGGCATPPDDYFGVYEALANSCSSDVKSAGPGFRHASHFHRQQRSLRFWGAAIRVGLRGNSNHLAS